MGKTRTPCLFVIDFDEKNAYVASQATCTAENVFYSLGLKTNCIPTLAAEKSLDLSKYPVSFAEYKTAFDIIQAELRHGNSYLVNLTFPTLVKTNLTLKEIFYASRAPYKLYFKDQFVVFSPEQFVTIQCDRISTYPMKGTIDAAIPNAAGQILSDEKEKAEHITIVDLLRNDLGTVARRIQVKRFRYIDEVQTHEKKLLQVSSEIEGKLDSDWNSRLGDIIGSLLPAGSVTGAPKKKTVEIIRSVETFPRGHYTGIFGYYDGASLESAVMIRFVEYNEDRELIFKSGGGITMDSDATSEYREMVDKVYVPIA